MGNHDILDLQDPSDPTAAHFMGPNFDPEEFMPSSADDDFTPDPINVYVPFTLGSLRVTILSLGKVVTDPSKQYLYWRYINQLWDDPVLCLIHFVDI